MNKFWIIIVLILGSTMSISAQKYHYLLDDFKAFKDRNTVVVTWVMGAGNSCVGVGIYRATDNVNFELIGEYKGICGSVSEPTNYSFVDEKPIANSINYYRLQLGFSGQTDRSVSVDFKDFSKRSYQVNPNPFINSTNISFQNDANAKHTLKLYDSIGRELLSQYSSDDTFFIDLVYGRGDNFVLPWPTSGIHYFVILDVYGQVVTSGSLFKAQ